MGMTDQTQTTGAKAMKRRGVALAKPVIPITVDQKPTSFGSLVTELKSPTSTVGRLNASKEWQEGFEACRLGTTRRRNPYGFETIENSEWHEGWRACFHKDMDDSMNGC